MLHIFVKLGLSSIVLKMEIKEGELSLLEKKIIRQIEYYFGDINLPRDKFMKDEMKETDGWITVETMLKFKRLAELTKDSDQILTALKKSTSGLMEVSSEEAKIRRSPAMPLPERTDEIKKQLEVKTAYAKGFDKEKTTMDELLEYYLEHEPSVINIQMRTYVDKRDGDARKFKGSVFLTFKNEEECKKFVSAEKHEYKGTALEAVKTQTEYFAEKGREREDRKKGKGGKNKNGTESNGDAKDSKDDDISFLPKGAVIKITGLGGDVTREDLKEKLGTDFEVDITKEGDIAFVTYQKGEAEAKIRFKTENFGKTLMEKINKVEKLTIKDMEVKITLLEGEEETNFLAEVAKDLKTMKNKSKGHKRKNFGKGGGGHAKKSRN